MVVCERCEMTMVGRLEPELIRAVVPRSLDHILGSGVQIVGREAAKGRP